METYLVKYSIETDSEYKSEVKEVEAETHDSAMQSVQSILKDIKDSYEKLGIECTVNILSAFPQSYRIDKREFALRTLENTVEDLATLKSILSQEGNVDHLGLMANVNLVNDICERVEQDCKVFNEDYKYYINLIKEGQGFWK